VPAKAPATAAAPAPSPVDGTLEEQWAAVLEAVRRQSRVTHTHLREAWPVELTDERLLIGFEKEFHAGELAKRPDHIARVKAALEEVFGRKIDLATDVRPADRPQSADQPAPAETEDQTAVDLVKRGLGAEVVEEVQS
jgi:hypothetical protein